MAIKFRAFSPNLRKLTQVIDSYTHHSIIQRSFAEELGQFLVALHLVSSRRQVLRLHGLAQVVVEKVEDAVAVD